MSGHIWDVKNYTERTVSNGESALRLARGAGLDFGACCRFVGYALESIRQESNTNVTAVWKRVNRSKHRYAAGRNRENYELAGRKLFSYLAGKVDLDSNTPAELVWDRMEDN
jgi:hypothetical protein